MKRLLFVGTYSVRGSRGLYACEADAATGRLTLLEEPVLPEPVLNPTFLACRGEWLYAVSELGDDGAQGPGALAAFRIRGARGALQPGPRILCGRGSPCHVLVFDGGRRLAVSQYKTGELYILPLDADGAPRDAEAVFRFEAHGPDRERQAGPHMHAACEAPDGETLFAADLGSDRLYRFRVTREAVTPLEPLVCPPGSGPRHMVMSADGRFLWAIGELDASLIGFEREGEHFHQFGHWPLRPEGHAGAVAPAEIRLHPRGHRLYVSNRGPDEVVVLAVQPDGRPTLLGRTSTGPWPRGMILSPDARFLYAASQHADCVTVFTLDPDTGLLASGGEITGIPSPVGFAFAD